MGVGDDSGMGARGVPKHESDDFKAAQGGLALGEQAESEDKA